MLSNRRLWVNVNFPLSDNSLEIVYTRVSCCLVQWLVKEEKDFMRKHGKEYLPSIEFNSTKLQLRERATLMSVMWETTRLDMFIADPYCTVYAHTIHKESKKLR